MTASFQGVQGTTCFAVCADQGIFDLPAGLLRPLRKLDRSRCKAGVISTGLALTQREHSAFSNSGRYPGGIAHLLPSG